MSLKERLLADLKEAMRLKEKVRKDTVQLCRAAILQVEKDSQITLDEEGVIDVIAKQLKSRRDVLPDYEKSGRTELIEVLHQEIEILMGYLPKQLTEAELTDIIKEALEQTGATSIKDMGKIMAVVVPKTKGRADAKLVGDMVKKVLNCQ